MIAEHLLLCYPPLSLQTMYLGVALLMIFDLLTCVQSQEGMIGYNPKLFLMLSGSLVLRI